MAVPSILIFGRRVMKVSDLAVGVIGSIAIGFLAYRLL